MNRIRRRGTVARAMFRRRPQFTVSWRTCAWQHGHRTRHSTHRRRRLWTAPREDLAYVVIVNTNGSPDALGVMDVNPESDDYGSVVGRMDLPTSGDELHHFGWNACSAALCPNMPHPHVERRYLLLGGLRSSNIYVVDTKSDPEESDYRQNDRSRRVPEEDGLQSSAHRTLRPGRDLHERAWRARRQRTWRHFRARP